MPCCCISHQCATPPAVPPRGVTDPHLVVSVLLVLLLLSAALLVLEPEPVAQPAAARPASRRHRASVHLRLLMLALADRYGGVQ